MNDEVTIFITSPELSAEQIQKITRDMVGSINNNVDEFQAMISANSENRISGAKGWEEQIGTIVLTLIGSGGIAVSLISVLRSYVERGEKLTIKIKTKKGEEVEINSSNLDSEKFKKASNLVNEILNPKDE